MPLMRGKSKKAFSKNVEIEMNAGKPQKQALAIAYSVKRRSKKAKGGSIEEGPSEKENQSGVHKIVPNYDRAHREVKHGQSEARYGTKMDKMAEHQKVLGELRKMPKVPKYAEGGEISAKDEKRPMPENTYNDSKEASRNSARKPLKNSDWTDNPTVKQAQMNNGRKVMPIAKPRMVPSDAFSTKLYDQEGKLMESSAPASPKEQPDSDYNERSPNRQGPKVPDMARQHNNDKPPYKEEIEDQYSQDEADSDMKQYAEGGEINKLVPFGESEEDKVEHPAHLEEDNDQMRPDEHEYMANRMPAYAEGGSVEDEAELEHHDSIAAAIMARRARAMDHLESGSDAMDMAVNDEHEDMPSEDHPAMDQDHYFEGGSVMERSGKILSHDSIDSDDSDMADLSRNHDEDANEEDQLSWNALRKENYNDSNLEANQPEDSNMKGDAREAARSDKHDMIAKIRAKRNNRFRA